MLCAPSGEGKWVIGTVFVGLQKSWVVRVAGCLLLAERGNGLEADS